MKQKLKQFIQDAKVEGISIAWCEDAQAPIQTMATGITDASYPKRIDSYTLFQAASLSKPVAAAIILDLVKQNKWDLDTPLAAIKAYGSADMKNNPYYQLLSTRMIIGQCSGLPNWFSEGERVDFIAEPGTQFTYSGVALQMLKEMIEYKLQLTWEAIAKTFFDKAGMHNATFKQPGSTDLKKRQVARGHQADGTPDPYIIPLDAVEIPAGSLMITAQDYLLFLKYCINDPDISEKMFTPLITINSDDCPKTPQIADSISWGLGFGIYRAHDQQFVFHWGSNTNSYAFTAINLTTKACVATFINSPNGPNLFKPITESIVNQMTPVFDWLSEYAGFNAKVKSKPISSFAMKSLFFKGYQSTQRADEEDKSEVDITADDMANSVFGIGDNKCKPHQS